jgi:carbonic anhydrase
MKALPVLVAVQSVMTTAIAGAVVFVSTQLAAVPPTRPHTTSSRAEAGAAGHGAAAAPAAHGAHGAVTGGHGETRGPTPAEVSQALFAGNERFVTDHPAAHTYAAERKALTGGQHPKAMVLSCSDSRLPPELVFDQSLGDLFVVRSAGNVADKIGLASLEYAAEHLGARVLVVLGHEKCGAVTAAAKGGAMPTDNLTALMEEIGPSLKDLRGTYQGEELVHRGIAANVEQTADEVLDRSPLLRKLVAEGELEVLQAVYDLETGKVKQLSGPEHALRHARAAR